MKKLLLAIVLGVVAISPAVATTGKTQNYQFILNGKRLVMDGAICAGIEFSTNGKTAKLRAEGDCTINDSYADTWRIKWLDDDNFLAIETERPNEISPPRVFAHQVISVNGNKVKMKDIWTGWNNFSDQIEIYKIK